MTTKSVVDAVIACMEAAKRHMVTKERDGVPLIVQHVKYSYMTKLFVVRLFNDQYVMLDDGLGLFAFPKDKDFVRVESDIERWWRPHS